MSMEDILKVLVDSRRQPASSQSTDPMSELIGGLLGRSQAQGSPAPQAPQGAGAQQGGLGDIMGMLEVVMGNQSGQSNTRTSDPVMLLLAPFVPKLAKKMNISPEIATIIVSFVVHKLLSHHPTSNRDSNSFNLDTMLQQMGSGNVDSSLLESSGMIRELSRKTGLDEATTTQGLNMALAMLGKQLQSSDGPASKPSSSTSMGKTAGTGVRSAGAKRGSQLKRR